MSFEITFNQLVGCQKSIQAFEAPKGLRGDLLFKHTDLLIALREVGDVFNKTVEQLRKEHLGIDPKEPKPDAPLPSPEAVAAFQKAFDELLDAKTKIDADKLKRTDYADSELSPCVLADFRWAFEK